MQMIRGHEFIVFSDDWGRHPSSCQHLFRQLLSENRVLWVNTIGMRTPKLKKYDLLRGIEKIFQWISADRRNTGGENNEENLTIISPLMWPFYRGVGQKINDYLLCRAIKKTTKALNYKSPIVVSTIPQVANIIGRLGEVLSVYYCVDNFAEWPGVDGETVRRAEVRILTRCDKVIATSRHLVSSLGVRKENVHYLPHGVDIYHFARAKKKSANEEVNRLSRPIICYYGLFDERTDQNIILSIANRIPTCTILIIGPVDTNIDKLKSCGNVKFIGAKSYDHLPEYVSCVDALMLPYKINELTKSINPLKLLEYIATEKPVLSTPIPEVLQYKNVVKICATKEEFIENILSLDKLILDKNNIKIALTGCSWQEKAQEFSGILTGGLRCSS